MVIREPLIACVYMIKNSGGIPKNGSVQTCTQAFARIHASANGSQNSLDQFNQPKETAAGGEVASPVVSMLARALLAVDTPARVISQYKCGNVTREVLLNTRHFF